MSDPVVGDTLNETYRLTRVIGGWWTGTDFDTWAGAMGSPWTTSDASVISAADRTSIKATITDAVTNRKGSLFALGLPATDPVMVNRNKAVSVIVAAEACLSRGDNFGQSAASIYAANGKRFSVRRCALLETRAGRPLLAHASPTIRHSRAG